MECGSYRLGSALVLARSFPEKTVYACDTFSGMPEPEAIDGHRRGDFGDVDLHWVRDVAKDAGNVALVSGDFRDTLGRFADEDLCLVYVDCDLYRSAKTAVRALWPRLVRGGLMLAHDYTNPACRGMRRCVDEEFGGLFALDEPFDLVLVRKT